jgi:hypothetical protein
MTRHKLRATFQTWTEEMAAQNGKTFTIVAMQWCLPEDHGGDNPEPMFDIITAEGVELTAHAEEVFEDWAVDVFTANAEVSR